MKTQTEYLCGQFKNDGTYDPGMYAAALVELFGGYSRSAVFKATDIRTGLASKYKFMPSIAEVREFLDEMSKPTQDERSAAFQRQREEWAREDAELAARKANDKKWGPEEWAKHEEFLAKLSGRPTKAQIAKAAKDRLVAQIGQEAFDKLPDYAPDYWAPLRAAQQARTDLQMSDVNPKKAKPLAHDDGIKAPSAKVPPLGGQTPKKDDDFGAYATIPPNGIEPLTSTTEFGDIAREMAEMERPPLDAYADSLSRDDNAEPAL